MKTPHNWDTAIDRPGPPSRIKNGLPAWAHLSPGGRCRGAQLLVPKKIVDSVESRGAGHFFWEVRFDARLREIRGQDELESLSFNDRRKSVTFDDDSPNGRDEELNAGLIGVE